MIELKVQMMLQFSYRSFFEEKVYPSFGSLPSRHQLRKHFDSDEDYEAFALEFIRGYERWRVRHKPERDGDKNFLASLILKALDCQATSDQIRARAKPKFAKRSRELVEHDGRKQTVTQWASEFGVAPSTISRRYRKTGRITSNKQQEEGQQQ